MAPARNGSQSPDKRVDSKPPPLPLLGLKLLLRDLLKNLLAVDRQVDRHSLRAGFFHAYLMSEKRGESLKWVHPKNKGRKYMHAES